jgi:hypothetical protein
MIDAIIVFSICFIVAFVLVSYIKSLFTKGGKDEWS